MKKQIGTRSYFGGDGTLYVQITVDGESMHRHTMTAAEFDAVSIEELWAKAADEAGVDFDELEDDIEFCPFYETNKERGV